MLIQFSLQNHLSFRNENILSLEAGERLRKFNDTNTMNVNHLRLLKNVILFGPNGSGKSNILHALKLFRMLVVKKAPSVTTKLPQIPFLLHNNKENNPTQFEIEFFINEVQYRYTISFTTEAFLYEHLEYYTKKSYVTYFERNHGEFTKLPKSLIDISKTVRPNTLFLFALQDKNDEHAINVTLWFDEYLLLCDGVDIEDSIDVLNDAQHRETFLELLKIADFNIKDIEINKTVETIADDNKLFNAVRQAVSEIMEDENFEFPSQRVKTELHTIYDVYNENHEIVDSTKLPLDLESVGTQKFIKIILEVLNAADKGKVLIFDEFDDSFHLAISQALIKLFNSKYNHNQFILTSHELQHLDCDIRKDQIYLLEKDYDGESHIFSLFDFANLETVGHSLYVNKKSRHDISFFKRYIEGVFGGNPHVDSEALISTLANRYKED